MVAPPQVGPSFVADMRMLLLAKYKALLENMLQTIGVKTLGESASLNQNCYARIKHVPKACCVRMM